MKVVLNFFLLIFLHVDTHLCLNFTADSDTVKGGSTNIVCSIDPSRFTTFITFYKDGISKTSCDNANLCSPQNSDSGRYQYSSNSSSVSVAISSLNHSPDSGIWECRLGNTENTMYNLVVKTIPLSTVFTRTIPESNSSEVENVKLSGRCYCIFPPPTTVKLYFRIGTGAFQFLQDIPDPFINKLNDTSLCSPHEFDVVVSDFTVKMMGKTDVFFEMHFGDYKTSNIVGPFAFKGLATPASTNNTDMSTNNTDMSTNNTDMSTNNTDMSTTVSEATSPPVKTSSSGLSQEIVITIIISSIFAVGGLVLLIVLVFRHCRQKNTEILAENRECHFVNEQGNMTKKDDLKSNKSRKSLFSEKRNIKRGSSSFDKKKNAHVEKTVPKGRMYQHYPQTIDHWNNCGNQHVFQNPSIEGNRMHHRNWPDNRSQPYSRPNDRMPYQSHYSVHPGQSEGMLQYYRADDMNRGQQMYQMQYVALKDMHIKDKSDSKRSSDRRAYERNWDMLY